MLEVNLTDESPDLKLQDEPVDHDRLPASRGQTRTDPVDETPSEAY